MWNVLSVIIVCVLLIVWKGLRVANRVRSVLSYTTFLTACEISEKYNTTFKPLFIELDPLQADNMMKKYEDVGMVVGRDVVQVRSQCHCPREYCLSFKTRRRRRKFAPKPLNTVGELLPGQVRA